jgi:hypothetical protein
MERALVRQVREESGREKLVQKCSRTRAAVGSAGEWMIRPIPSRVACAGDRLWAFDGSGSR